MARWDSAAWANDYLWGLSNEIETPATPSLKGELERNVEHLKIIVADKAVVDSKEDIKDLQDAITVGEAKLAEDIWLSESE